MGSSAGALTGLMFVVIALMGDLQGPSENAARAMRAFASPTIFHFSAVLTTAGVLSIPRLSRTGVGIFLIAGATIMLAYVESRVVGARKSSSAYVPDLEDRLFYFILPTIAYAALLGGGILAWSSPGVSTYIVAGSLLGLLVIGIHNAWDAAVWQLIRRRADHESGG
jgi:hypothetical protein